MDDLTEEVPLGVRLVDLETRGVLTIHDPYGPDDVARMLNGEADPDEQRAREPWKPVGEVGSLPGVPIIGSADVVNSGPARKGRTT